MIDKEFLIENYQRLQENFAEVIRTIQDEFINKVPDGGGWTPAQVVKHICAANNANLLTEDGREANRDVGLKIPELEKTFMNFSLKMKSPDFLVPDSDPLDKDQCITKIRETFQLLAEALSSAKLDEITDSLFESLTKWEIANFFIFHSKRHLFQLSNLGYLLKVEHRVRVAESFSKGRFTETYDYLAPDVHWVVVEESETTGKEEVIKKCGQVAAYFESVETDFKTQHIVRSEQIVVVSGTAEFFRGGTSISFVSACDMYEFDDSDHLSKITSYCIQRKKD